ERTHAECQRSASSRRASAPIRRQAFVRGQSSVDPKSIVAAGLEIFEAGLHLIMNSEKALELEGTIMSVLPGTMVRVALANVHLVLAHISGRSEERRVGKERGCGWCR